MMRPALSHHQTTSKLRTYFTRIQRLACRRPQQQQHPALQPNLFRQFSFTRTGMASKDWSATQYLKFNAERTRPSRDLLAQVPLASPKRIVDLGCGPGNSTAVLVEQYPDSKVLGIDSSPDMIEKARAALPDVEFTLDDLSTYKSEHAVDLFFSNAVFQWLSGKERIRVIKELFETQATGGVFAFQVPDNFHEPSHVAMREVAANGPWAQTLEQLQPARELFQSPQELYDELSPLSSTLNIWHTYYQHVLESHEAIVEWVKGTGLRPFINPLNSSERHDFLKEYLQQLKELYPTSRDGKVLLRYPRLFLIAVRR